MTSRLALHCCTFAVAFAALSLFFQTPSSPARLVVGGLVFGVLMTAATFVLQWLLARRDSRTR